MAAEAWHVFGYGIGQAQIIVIGLTVATSTIVTYRITTRGKKYRHE